MNENKTTSTVFTLLLTFQEFLSLAKKKDKKKKSPTTNEATNSESESEDGETSPRSKKRPVDNPAKSSSEDEAAKKDEKVESEPEPEPENNSEPEEGEVSDSSSSEEEFDDGYDDQLMGDEEDRAHLASLTEKERETEIFKRIEQRELKKTRLANLGLTIEIALELRMLFY